MRFACMTDVGRTRSMNQDTCCAEQLSDDIALAVVCDGLGGVSGGEVASEIAVRAIVEQISAGVARRQTKSMRYLLETAVAAANALILEQGKARPELAGMGTTAVVALAVGGVAHIAHVGDSRAYLVDGAGMTQLTRDHSMVQALVESGDITPEQALQHPRRNVITRALGAESAVRPDYCEQPLGGGILLLCTDGLTNYADTAEIPRTVKENDFFKVPELLVDMANRGGGGDNISVALLAE